MHGALSSPARVRLLDLLRGSEDGRDVRSLAGAMDLHVNTVRAHLNVLADAGLVAVAPEDRDRPGRPRMLYRTTDAAARSVGDSSYRMLAEMLSGLVSTSVDDPAEAAIRAGEAWGRWMTDGPQPFRSVTDEDGVRRVVEMLDDLGFAPEPSDRTIDLRRCPFVDVARDHEQVVCSLHLGLIRGVLDELGVDVRATELRPLVEPDLCVAHLEVGSA